ncbi:MULTISPECIES: rRNA maturation RNase YbeY [unclassified Psychrobacter]|uniref:rRNA maturation RNase YbeY n=1 Tax=unclassified Psychrobacter TaxID=196806 RepID=UPI003FD24D7E
MDKNDRDDISSADSHSVDLDSTDLDISAAESINSATIESFYNHKNLIAVMLATLEYIDERIANGLVLPYFAAIDKTVWQDKIKSVEIYITDELEGRALNLEARDKDYATNILSYPSDLPTSIIHLMPTLPLGELIICHEVIVREAAEQNKSLEQHISHLLVHGILHLLGFDHEIGQAEQDEMEQFEIEILAGLGIPNPYLKQ